MDILSQLYKAKCIWTEMEIEYYYDNWKKCDFVTIIGNENVGVSVTRVLPPVKMNPDDYDKYVAQLLYKKLHGLVVSRAGALNKAAFSRSMLFAWSPSRVVSRIIQATFDICVDETLKDDVELIIVEANEQDLRDDFPTSSQFTFLRT